MPSLLLQHPDSSATHKERVACLSRRLDLWTDGQFQDLLREGRVIQEHLERTTKRGKQRDQEEDEARFFGRMMFQGKVKGALRALSESGRGRVLMLDEETSPGVTVREALKSKHPPAGSVHTSALLDEQPPDTHPIIFECLNGNMVRSAALHCQGSAGPSGLDASNWRRLCTMFHGSSKSLCSAVAAAARRLCTSYVDPRCIGPLTACRLIPLSKDPGVRPIGVCETLRRIIGKTILQVVGNDIQAVCGTSQLCARQRSECETMIAALRQQLDCGAEGLLLVDARNAFNTLNRRVMLHNVSVLCPSFAPCVVNYYRANSQLFVGDEVIASMEGTTQGDPLSMAIYALATIPLIARAQQSITAATQCWFADDAGAAGRLRSLFAWWTKLETEGHLFGYDVNPPKTWLVVGDEHLQEAHDLFGSTGINITTEGRPVLGHHADKRSTAGRFAPPVWSNGCRRCQNSPGLQRHSRTPPVIFLGLILLASKTKRGVRRPSPGKKFHFKVAETLFFSSEGSKLEFL